MLDMEWCNELHRCCMEHSRGGCVRLVGYKLVLIMPANMSEERRAAMAAYGARLISVPAGKMELARDLAAELQVGPLAVLAGGY